MRIDIQAQHRSAVITKGRYVVGEVARIEALIGQMKHGDNTTFLEIETICEAFRGKLERLLKIAEGTE